MTRTREMRTPFSVHDFDDMMRILEAQPEWRSRMRRALFPEIDVPKALERLSESTAALLASMRDLRDFFESFKSGQTSLQQDTQDLKAGQQELFQRTDRLEIGQQELRQELHTVKEDVSVLKTDVSVLKTDVSVLKTDVSVLKTDVSVLKTDVSVLKTDVSVLKTDVSVLKTDVSVLKTDVSVLKTDVSVLKTDVSVLKTDVSVLKTDVREIKSEMGVMRGDVGTLKGKVHEAFYRDKAGAIFGVYLRNGREVTNQIADQLHDAVGNGLITQDEFTQVLAADLLWGGRERTDGHEVVLVVEASWLAQLNDIERAQQRAIVLRRLGLDALAVAAGNEWTDDAATVAQEMGVVRVTNGSINFDSWQNARARVNRE
jgi:phage shock protein A